MNVEKLIQAAEWCVSTSGQSFNGCSKCPILGHGQCLTQTGCRAILAVRDHVRAEQQHQPCGTCGHDKETGDTECKIKHYVSYCSNHTELDRLKGVE